MTMNGVMVVILGYFTKFGTFGSELLQNGWRETIVCDKNVVQRI